MNLKQHLEQTFSLALQQLTGLAEAPAQVARAKNAQFGDYQVNGVMPLAKRLGRNPRDLAQQLCAQVDLGDLVDKVEVAGPGFINLTLSLGFLNRALSERSGKSLVAKSAQPRTVVIDYSSPNLAKEMHVGHLRGTIIGDAIARVFDYLGHRLIRQNHFGDWGTQFGMLITHMQELGQTNALTNELSDLETFYRQAKQRFDADTGFAERARLNVVKLQSGDADCLAMWRSFIAVSVAHCDELYRLLGITLTQQHMVPESFYNSRLAGVVEALDAKGLLKTDAGARCVFLDQFKSKEGEPLPVIVQKSDGGFLYATTDLAAIQYRCQDLHADRVLYVVDARQSLHFQQVFAVAKLAGFANETCSLEHLSYGTMMGKDNKPFKTRSGDTVKLVDLCRESIERALALVSAKNPELPAADRQRIADVVGIAAVKYADLSKNRNSDYVFDWDTMLAFDGNTAPYLLYAYARICSIFRRAGIDHTTHAAPVLVAEPSERDLAIKLLQFPEVVEALAEDCLPNQLCLYLYELAGCFMQFYEACPILKADTAQQAPRLALARETACTLATGLQLLGITPLEQM